MAEQASDESSLIIYKKYKQKHPKSPPLTASSSLFSTLLSYFSQENIHVCYGGADLLGDNKEVLAEAQTIFSHWIEEKNPDSTNGNVILLTDFIEYMLQSHGDRFEIREGKDHQQREQNQEEQEESPVKNKSDDQGQKKSSKSPRQSMENRNTQYMFNRQHELYLLDYYRYYSMQVHYVPKGQTFDHLKQIYSSMKLTQWMQFNKNVGLIQEMEKLHHGKTKALKFFKQVFMNFEDCSKRLTFIGFCETISSMIQISQTLEERPIGEWISFFGLQSDQNHYNILEKLKIPFIRQKVPFPKRSLQHHYPSKLSTKQNTKTKQKSINTSQIGISKSRYQSGPAYSHHNLNIASTQSLSKISNQQRPVPSSSKFKYYRTHEERKQSQLMKKLTVQNLGKISPDIQVKDSLRSLIGEDDQFLKQYTRRQEQIKKGVLKRIDNKAHKYRQRK